MEPLLIVGATDCVLTELLKKPRKSCCCCFIYRPKYRCSEIAPRIDKQEDNSIEIICFNSFATTIPLWRGLGADISVVRDLIYRALCESMDNCRHCNSLPRGAGYFHDRLLLRLLFLSDIQTNAQEGADCCKAERCDTCHLHGPQQA
ncbi:hypothetical protein C0J52_09123 [Blattella germanica]|nr:hypothetical protein C0J52_09123 [Blattella germanica]